MLIVFHRTDSRQLLLAHRKPLEYGQVVSNVQAVQDVFQEVNSSLLVRAMTVLYEFFHLVCQSMI